MKKIFWALGSFVFAVAAVLVAPGLIDWNQYKNEIQDQIRSVTARDIHLNGDISLTILPTPALIANDVYLANVRGAQAKNLLELKYLEVRIALVPLLGGQVQVEGVKLVDPVIELEVLSDGRRNWMFEAETTKSGKSSAKALEVPIPSSENKRTTITKSKSRTSVFTPPVSLDGISIKNGTLIYRNSIDGTFEKIEAVDANFSAASIKGPFESSGQLITRGLPIAFDLNVGEIIHGRTLAFGLRAAIEPGDANMLLSGTLIDLEDAPRIKGSIKGEAKSIETLIKAAQGVSFPGPLNQDFSFEANIAAWAGGAEIKDVELRLGDTKASGVISVKVDETLSVSVRLGTGHFDIDQWLSPQENSVSSASPNLSGVGSAVSLRLGKETGSKLKEQTGFLIPRSVQASLMLTAEVMTFRGGVVRNGLVSAELTNGEITLSQASAQFPGGSDIALFGFVTAVDDKPHFAGELESTVNDLRGVLDWLGHDIDGVAKDRLRKLMLATQISISSDQIKLSDIKLQFDSTRLTGGVTVALRKRPSFGARIMVNKINLDAYLPKQKKKKFKKKSISDLANLEDRRKVSPVISREKNPFLALKFLNDLDANLTVRVKSLTLRGGVIKNAVFDGTVHNGSLDIRHFGADRVSNSTFFAEGKISNFGGIPKADALSFKAKTERVNGLLRFVGLSGSQALKSLGAVHAYGQIDGSILTPTVNLNLAGSGAQVKVFGQLDGLALVPAVRKLKVQIEVKNTSKLLKLAGIKAISARQLGVISVDGEIDGTLLAPKLAFDLKAVGGSATVSGKINTLPIGDLFDLLVHVNHPDVANLLRSMGGYNPAGKVGSLDIKGHLLGGLKGVSLNGVTAKAGNVDLQGDVAIEFDGVRPQINANLTGGNITIDPFLPARRNASFWPGLKIRPVVTRRQISGWSTDPIDLSGLAGIDAKVALKSPSVKYERYNLQNANLSVSLGQGFLRADKLTGVIFGGALRATAATTTTSRPRMEIVLALEDVNIAQTTRALAGGKMGLQVSLNSAGGNVSDLISGLSGKGSLRLNGINVQKGENGTMLAGALGLVSAINQVSGLSSNEKKSAGLVDIAGSFSIRRGIAKSRDIQIVSGLGEGTAEGVVDIPRWEIDFKGNVKLGQNILTSLVSRGTKSNITQSVPFAVYGKLDSPNIKMDTSRIAGGALRIPGVDKLLKKLPKGVGGVLKGILSGKPNQQAKDPNMGNTSPPPESQQQQKKLDPVNIMKEIFRRR